MEITDIIQSGIDNYIGNIWNLVASLAGIGILSMAIVEIFRLIFQPRMFFNQYMFKRWLKKNCMLSAEQDIIKLSTGGSAYLLYTLPIEKMSGQINAAAQIALAYPFKYKSIIKALGFNADTDDIDNLIMDPLSIQNTQEYANARNRVSNMMQRNLDALQIQINGIWSRLMQLAGVLVSIVLIISIAGTSEYGIKNPSDLILFAVFGGMIAPVAKDILTQLTNVKNRPR